MTKTKEKVSSPPLAVLERKFKGHTRWVNSVAVSPDGIWAVSGASDRRVKIWDLSSGLCMTTLKGHKRGINCVAVTPDGMWIISGADDQTLRVWETKTGRLLTTCKGHTGQIWSVAALPDSRSVLSGSTDETLKLWDIHSGKCLKTFNWHGGSVYSVAVFPNGKRAVSGAGDKTIKLWDLETGQNTTTLKGHADWIRAVQITPDGVAAVSGASDKTVKLWDLSSSTCAGTFEGHGAHVLSVALSPDGKLAASTGYDDHTLRIWDVITGACLQVIREKESPSFISVTFSPDGSRLVTGTYDGHIYIYKLTDVKAAQPLEANERYTNAKVVLVGESGVGKSGLAHRLIQDKFVSTYSTHGMQMWPLELPINEKEGLQREAILWDLAGQEDYRLIHQLFLDETALALLLINPQKDDPFAEAGDWLNVLDAATTLGSQSREAQKLLIAARTDVGAVKVSQKKIDAFLKEHGLAAYLPTSAMTGQNCSDSLNNNQPSSLKELIAKHIPWDTLPWTSSPRLLRELKKAVITVKETGGSGLLRFPELYQRLEAILNKTTFTEQDVRTAVTLLGNHGLVMLLTFGDLVLLKPELLNGYASAVIRAARTHIDEIGCVAETDVFQKTISFEGFDRLPSADEDLMLRAMVQTFLDRSLCISEETENGKQFIFPSQYRRERPIPHKPEIFVSYSFSGELATVYTTLVVRLWYSRGFDNKELWRNAAEFETSTHLTAGLRLTRTGEGEGTICVFFDPELPDDLKVVFIEYVHQHLHKYAAGVRRKRRYVCRHCKEPVENKKAVSKRLKAGKTFIVCQFCDEEVELIDHIEQRLGTDPVARKVHRMDERATQGLDNDAKEQILIGHMMAICGEANQIFRPTTMFDKGIDGVVEFKDDNNNATARKIYVQLKSGDSFLRERKRDNQLIFDVKKDRHLTYWAEQKYDVYLVIRNSEGLIRWMNITHYLKTRKDKTSRQIPFTGDPLDAAAVLRLRKTILATDEHG